MIVSRWRGFEIDSSEGYYHFRKEPEHTEEGWNLMLKLLRSPLILDGVAFSLTPRSGRERVLRSRLRGLLEETRIEKIPPAEDYLSLDYKAPIPVFVKIVQPLRDSLKRVQVNVCFKPFADLPPEEFRSLRSWFLVPGNADNDERSAQGHWETLAKVGERDLDLFGSTDNRHAENIALAFEANFQLDLEKPFWYEVTTSGVDPTLIEYLFHTLMTGFELEYVSD